MVKYIGFFPRMEEFTWKFDAGAEVDLLTVRLVPGVPPGKFTVTPDVGKLTLVPVADAGTLPLPVVLLNADPLSGEVVR
jgi:hypothetical protein